MKYIKNNWDRVILVLIMSLTGFLNFYEIGKEGYSNQYYAAAVKSMLSSFHNFFFASFDPGGYVTVDKPAFGLWLQTISALIFGFHGWSIILPEALSAVVSVALIFHIVKRSFGKAAGIASAAVLGLTPILIAVSRTNNLDSSLVMVLLFAAWALIVGAERGSLKLLLLSMMLVGIGFNIKMLEAFMVLPAFYLVYLFASNLKVSKRIIHLVLATAVLLVVSLSWAVIVDLTPSDTRPYIGSSKTNSVLELALGYNGIQRLTGNQHMGGPGDGRRLDDGGYTDTSSGNFQNRNRQRAGDLRERSSQIPHPNGESMWNRDGQRPNEGDFRPPDQNMRDGFNTQYGQGGPGFGAPGGMPDGMPGGGFDGGFGGGPGGEQENGQKGILRIFNKNLAGQISWFLPMALFGILILSFEAFRKDEKRNMTVIRHLILFSAIVIPMIAFFSVAGFYHRYYLSMLAPGIAALSGIGISRLWKAYLGVTWKWVMLPISLLVTLAVQVLMLSRYADWNKRMIPIVGAVCVFSAAALIVIRLLKKDNLNKIMRITLVTAFVSLLAAPCAWSFTPILYGVQTSMPAAGPDELTRGGGMGPGNRGSGFMGRNNENGESSELVKFLLSKYKNEKYLVAVADANQAASIIIETGKPVMAVGGFSGSDNILTVKRLEEMVKKGEIRYFEVGMRGMGQNSEITTWVTQHGKAVTLDSTNTGNSASGNSNRAFWGFQGMMGMGTLYDLAPEKG